MASKTPIQRSAGQESVWDYPRPPRAEPTSKHVQVVFNGVTIADTHQAIRVLETSHPPVYYLPPSDVQLAYFLPATGATFCEYKGVAAYYTIAVGARRAEGAAWYYPQPTPRFAAIANYIALYPSRMEACYVDGERVVAQPGDFYGGWITKDIVGPFKGAAGTAGW